MKKLLTLIAGFLIWNVQIMVATDVAGTISTDSTWNVANSPYIVTTSVTINHGVTLTIDPGVTVKFNSGQCLYVNGSLNASNVIFTSGNVTPSPGDWGHIQVGSGSDSGSVVLNTCQVQYANQLYVLNGTAALTSTDLSSFGSHGVNLEGNGNLTMTGGSIITNNAWAGLNGYGIYMNSGASSVVSGVNIQNFAYGIYFGNYSLLSISNINITNCIWPIGLYSAAHFNASGTNSFSGNTNSTVFMNFGSMTGSMTLPKLDIPYYFPYGMAVETGGTLVISSGNILKFSDNTSLTVRGTLVANANPSDAIYFTSYRDDNWGGDTNKDGSATAPAQGNWYGIRFEYGSVNENNIMRRCNIRYAGAAATGGISMFGASPTIDSCDISNNYYGIYLEYTSNPVLSNNIIGSSEVTPIAMSYEADPVMSNNTLSFSDNSFDAIGLLGGYLTADSRLRIRNVTTVSNITYLQLANITVPAGKTLIIDKGVVLKSISGGNYRILVEGTLLADATADSMITITSSKDDSHGNPGDSNKDGTITSPEVGDFGGIIFLPGSTGTLNYCRIKYARIYYYGFTSCSTTEWVNEAGIAMIDASPTISNCEFKDLDYGLSCYRASNPVISNTSMINIKYTPVCISGSSNPSLSGITFTNIGMQAIGLLGGNVCQNGTIKKRDLAGYSGISYVLISNMYINSGTYVNVEPGVVIKMANSSIFVDGGFKTDGTVLQPVIFTSIMDDNVGNPFDSNGDGNATTPTAGNWGAIKFNSTSDDAYSVLRHTYIKNAGNTSVGGVCFENAGGSLKNSWILNSSNYGVYCNGNSTPVIDSVSIQNCGMDPIAMSLTSDPTLTNITFNSNYSQAIRIIEGTLSSDAVLYPRNVAGISNIAYIIYRQFISSNAKLTIQPGVVIKFRPDTWYGTSLVVEGNLVANGTPAEKIYFTSFNDDSKGGDSNNNGNTTVPQKGDWGYEAYYFDGGIIIRNNNQVSDTVNSLKYCEFSYARIGLRIDNSHATIDNCTFQQTYSHGASVVGSANPDFTNCQFYNITSSPVELSMFSNPTFTNCSALNVGLMALAVIPETYTQDAIVPVRSFAGFDNISYFMVSPCIINSGTTITIPAGIVFKAENATGFTVNGKLKIEGTASKPVIFTSKYDDHYSNPADMNGDGTATLPPDLYYYYPNMSGTWLNFNDVSDDSSIVRNAVFKYGNTGISTLSASPSIDSVKFENLFTGIDMSGVSSPKIDNCVFHNLKYFPMQISLISYPASSSGNLISGITYKVIKVRNETLTQDAVLPIRDFGGVMNIPYYFEQYTVGTGATLTVKPGVVCKFSVPVYYWYNAGQLDIFKGFSAIGGSTPDSTIVFTSILDDFYGGDSNADSSYTLPEKGNWQGLIFENESLDPMCNLKNCVIRYATNGIKTISASPVVLNSNINFNYYGVNATAASNPVFTNCDFDNNYNYAIDNVDKSFTINAVDCWWGSNLGPVVSGIPANGFNAQEFITESIQYSPWKTSGAENPVMGDVTLNGMVQAFDASFILQNVVGSLTLNTLQQKVADVSSEMGITAYDASLVLQYVVGLIQTFPAEMKKSQFTDQTNPKLIVFGADVENGVDFDIALALRNVKGMYSAEVKLKYDPSYLKLNSVTGMIEDRNYLYSDNPSAGVLTIAMAGTGQVESDGDLALVSFRSLTPTPNSYTDLTVTRFLANERNLTDGVTNGNVRIGGEVTGISQGNKPVDMMLVYPNPSSGDVTFTYHLNKDNIQVTADVFDLTGRKVVTLINRAMNSGNHSISVLNQGTQLEHGTYLLRLTVDGSSQSLIFRIE